MPKDYRLCVTTDFQRFVFEYGNSDHGALNVTHVVRNAKVFDVDALNVYSLAELISHCMTTCEPNQWGFT